MTLRSRLYIGSVVHRRFRPRAHNLSYRVFWILLDLDEIDIIARERRLFSHNRFNVFSFHDKDYGDASGDPLRKQVERNLRAAGISSDGLRIEMLCMPRILGYQFNPLSVYFCRQEDGGCSAILYEVHNTFGERHSYLFQTTPIAPSYEHRCDKEFYVSPFLDMDMTYQFNVTPPDEKVSVRIEGADAQGPLIVASLAGERVDLTDRALLRTFVTCPLVTLKVLAAIHWNALLMLVKGFRLRPRPAKPANPVSTIATPGIPT